MYNQILFMINNMSTRFEMQRLTVDNRRVK